MTDELAYVIVTPYSIRKSRTGGIIGRLISRTGLDLTRARMYSPSLELANAFADQIPNDDPHPGHRKVQELIQTYIRQHFAPRPSGGRQRVLLLVFRGADAVEKIRDTVGHIVHERTSGETIRDTYGDYVTGESGDVTYFEPAVLAAPDAAAAEATLKLWASYSDADGGLLDRIISYADQPGEGAVEKTLVLIKPDNFLFPNARPGSVIDVFSRSGLFMVGFKVHRMSVAEAEDFYRPVLAVLQQIYKERAGLQARLAIERDLGLMLDPRVEQQLGEMLGPISGRQNWENLIQFMAGGRPGTTPQEQRQQPGSQKSIALVYEGRDAVRKIREVLGPTDPAKAPTGSIRREFGQSIMVNAAHASDSAENAQREMKIVKVAENNLKPLIEEFYGKQ